MFAPPLPGKSFLQLIEATDPLAAAADSALTIADAQLSAQASVA